MHEAVRTGNLIMDLLVLSGYPPETQDSEGSAEVALLTKQHTAAAYLLRLLDSKDGEYGVSCPREVELFKTQRLDNVMSCGHTEFLTIAKRVTPM
jgi:hypothetical protein